MAWLFGDSFDFYATAADALVGWWDSGSSSWSLTTGRFTGSQAAGIGNLSNGAKLTKSSGANDAIHHLVFAIQQTATLSGTTLSLYFQLLDGTTNQCCLVFRSDGALVLTSGGPTGTALATYTGAISAQSVWTAFEVEVVINNTTGSITVRKNGNTGTPDFTATGLNTRGGTANNYANKLTVGMNTFTQQIIDDLLWRSDPSSVAWVGDIRAYQLMPASDVSVQFSKAPISLSFAAGSGTNLPSMTMAASQIWFYPFVSPTSGPVYSLWALFFASQAGHWAMALYDATGAGGAPGALLASTNVASATGGGVQTVSFATPPTVVAGTAYYIAFIADTGGANIQGGSGITTGYQLAFTYSGGAFPSSAAGATLQPSHSGYSNIGMNAQPLNNFLVNEAHEDGTTTYVYDPTVGHADFYGIQSLPITPSSIIAVTTRGFVGKSDAGSRSARVQMKSGATTVQSASLALSTNFQWLGRTDVVDPNTSAGWTAAAVNALTIGPLVSA